MQLRPATAADEQALADIRRHAILALAVPAMPRDDAEAWASQGAPDRIARAIREHDVWVAVADAAVVGWVEVAQDRIAALYVSPSCARRGIGSLLLEQAEAQVLRAGHAMAQLESSLNALDFYLGKGYLRYGPPDGRSAIPLRKVLAVAGFGPGR